MKRASLKKLPATRRIRVAGFLLGDYIRNKTLCFIISCIFFYLSWASPINPAYGIDPSSNNFSIDTVAFLVGGGAMSSTNFSTISSIGENAALTGRSVGINFSSIAGEQFLLTEDGLLIRKTIADLKALTEVLGNPILESTWQKDDDPYFYWTISIEPQESVDGCAVSLDKAPEQEITTTDSFYQFPEHSISSGKHTFYVLPYIRGKGWNETKMLQFPLWVDVEPPLIVNFKPISGQIIPDDLTPITCLMYDAHSGLDLTSIILTLSNHSVTFEYDEAEQLLKSTPSTPLPEGLNTVLLKAYDLVGNYVVKGWDFIIDAHGPTGSIMINNGEEFSHSAYVSINIKAEDPISGIKNIYLSNDGVFDAELAYPYSYSPLISNWLLTEPDVDGVKTVYAKFEDIAGNMSETFSAQINLKLTTPDTHIISGPENITEATDAHFKYEASKTGCQFSYKLDALDWSEWSSSTAADFSGLNQTNHYFYVKSGYDLNGDGDITVDEEDATPAQWAWSVKAPGELEKMEKRILFWRR